MEPLTLIQFGVGLVVLTAGAEVFVRSASHLASALGVSSLVIGLTVVAFGTSSPELAVVLQAAFEGQADIAIGNVVGSNIFNILMVLRLGALLSPRAIEIAPAALNFDIPVMVVVAIACLPVFFVSHRISRWEGLLFLGLLAVSNGWFCRRRGDNRCRGHGSGSGARS